MADDKEKDLESKVNSEVHLMGIMYSLLEEQQILEAQVTTNDGRKMTNNLGKPMSYDEALKTYYGSQVKALDGKNSLSAKVGTLSYEALKVSYSKTQKEAKFSEIVALAEYVKIDTATYKQLVEQYGDTNYEALKKDLAEQAKNKSPAGARAGLILRKIDDLYKEIVGKSLDKLNAIGQKQNSTYLDANIAASDPKSEYHSEFVKAFEAEQTIQKAKEAMKTLDASRKKIRDGYQA